jgi:hypothetical protein
MKNRLPQIAAAGVAAVAIAFAAIATGSGSSDTATGTAGAANRTPPQAAQGQVPQQGQAGRMRPGFGTPVTGATADKVGKAVRARHPGEVERVMQLPDGSYVAHVITDNGEVHVAVSKAFEATGTLQRRSGPPPSGAAAPPSGTTPPAAQDGSASSSGATTPS